MAAEKTVRKVQQRFDPELRMAWMSAHILQIKSSRTKSENSFDLFNSLFWYVTCGSRGASQPYSVWVPLFVIDCGTPHGTADDLTSASTSTT
jgi:hypothetical protein